MKPHLLAKNFPFSPQQLPLPIAIVNFGVTGRAIRSLLLTAGLKSSDIAILDEPLKIPPAQAIFFTTPQKLLAEFKPKTLVVSPGYPLATDWIQKFASGGGLVTTELEIAHTYLTTERVIAVTGSVGKSTSVSLLEAGLAKFSASYFVGGNLGIPLAHYVEEVLNSKRTRADWVVLELSSYQLECFKNLRAEISGITSLTPNHMERYATLADYYQTKLKLFSATDRSVVLNNPGGELFRYLDQKEQWNRLQAWENEAVADIPRKVYWVRPQDPEFSHLSLEEAQLLGRHNQENLAFAAKIALLANWPKSAIEGMKEFKGLAHRLEVLGSIGGVIFVNDSKSTTIASVQLAVESALAKVASGSRVHLLLGGRDKNLPWGELAALAQNVQIQLHFFGECADIAIQQMGLDRRVATMDRIDPSEAGRGADLREGTADTDGAVKNGSYRSPTLKEALPLAWKCCRDGDILLLSPGGTSLDEFQNFEARGRSFQQFFCDLTAQ